MVHKFDISGFTNNFDFDKKIAIVATKAKLKAEQDEIIEIFDSDYFRGKSHFEDDRMQNCLVFQSIYRYFKKRRT